MQGTIKERLFSKFTLKDSYMDNMQVYKLNKVCRDKFSTIDYPRSRKTHYQTITTFREKSLKDDEKRGKMNSTYHYTPSKQLGFK